jgi:hypothetical protein
MGQPTSQTQRLHEGLNYPSPFTRVLGLGFYDGPTNGVLDVGEDGAVFKFDMVNELMNPEGVDLRVFGLAPLPGTALVELADAYGRYQNPRWPLWVPIWRFPTLADQQEMEQVTDQVLQQAGPLQWVVAAYDLLQDIVAARPVTPDEVGRVDDWASFLGLDKPIAVKK